jgi:hypothetical protein
MGDGTVISSWIPVPNGAACPADGARLWLRQVWEPLCWYWEHMCPECRAVGQGMPSPAPDAPLGLLP